MSRAVYGSCGFYLTDFSNEEMGPVVPEGFDFDSLELVPAAQQPDAQAIRSVDLFEGARSASAEYGLNYLFQLYSHAENIPEGWNERVPHTSGWWVKPTIVFAGSDLRDKHGRRYMAIMRWHDDRWDHSYVEIGNHKISGQPISYDASTWRFIQPR